MASPSEFYNAVYSTAISLGANDIQARLAAAQASEETGYGKSMVGNNLFGVKAGSNYTGNTVTASTNEEYNGVLGRETAKFRAYDDFTQSVKDYLGVVQKNFPDAWNATSFSDAVKGLDTGVYGKYATLSDYSTHIKSIDKKYGNLQYAANPQNVPVPYSPTETPPDYAVADDVLPLAQPNFAPVDPNAASYEFAMNPTNVPVPTMQDAGLLSSFQEQQPASQSPFDAVMAPQQSAEWGVINGVGPVYTPAFNQWADMAAAQPVQAPMGSVQESGLLGATPDLQASTSAGLLSNATPSERMGLAEPGFDMARFTAQSPTVAEIDSSRFSTPAKTSRIGTSLTMTDTARMNPLTGAINPATNTQSFMDQPADLGSMPAAYAAQRGPSSGLLSADAQTVQGLAERNLQREAGLLAPNPALATPNFNQALSPTVPGLLGGIDYAPTSAVQQSSMAGLMASPEQQASGYNQAAQSLRQAGIMNIGQQPPTDLSGNLPTNFNVLNEAAPALETITVAEQPAITDQTATIDGPTNTPAVQQQNAVKTPAVQQQTQQTATQPSLTDRLAKAINPGTVAGGLVGGLTLGPVGGLLGSLLGNSAYNGGLNGLLGSGFVAPTNQIAGGVNNIAGIYGGLYSPGTYAMANNGAQVSALGGGYTGYTNKYGVSEVVSPTGQISRNFGSLFGNDDNEEAA